MNLCLLWTSKYNHSYNSVLTEYYEFRYKSLGYIKAEIINTILNFTLSSVLIHIPTYQYFVILNIIMSVFTLHKPNNIGLTFYRGEIIYQIRNVYRGRGEITKILLNFENLRIFYQKIIFFISFLLVDLIELCTLYLYASATLCFLFFDILLDSLQNIHFNLIHCRETLVMHLENIKVTDAYK